MDKPKTYRIKPLVWEYKKELGVYRSKDFIWHSYECNYYFWKCIDVNGFVILGGECDTLDECKAAANAHHVQQVEKYLEEIV